MSDPLFGNFMLPGFPFRFSSVSLPDAVTAPDLGEHNQTVLTQYLNYSAARIAELTNAGVLASERTPRE